LLELDKDETEQSFDELAEKVRNVLTQIEQSPQLKKDSNNHHLWARLYRDAFMYGDVLNLYDMRVLAAWRIFSLRLKKMLDESKVEELNSAGNMFVARFNDIDLYEIKTCYLEFMGQLIRLGEKQSARLIHQYLGIAKKITQYAESEGGMSLEQVATVTNLPFLHGLSLSKALSPEESNVLVNSKESRFIAEVLKKLLQITPLNKSFEENLEYYGSFSQNDPQFREHLVSLLAASLESLTLVDKGLKPLRQSKPFAEQLDESVAKLKSKKPSEPALGCSIYHQAPWVPNFTAPDPAPMPLSLSSKGDNLGKNYQEADDKYVTRDKDIVSQHSKDAAPNLNLQRKEHKGSKKRNHKK
ncbi:MAG: hypothetical protein AB7V32_01885, partial [Candidatus Berkiella sp.]